MSKTMAEQLKAFGFKPSKNQKKVSKQLVAAAPRVEKKPDPQAEKKLIKKQIKTWVLENQLNVDEANHPYYFEHCQRAKKMYVTKEQQAALVSGEYAITVLDKRFYIIPRDLGEKIKTLAPQYAVYWQSDITLQDQSHDYTEFVVPDDLVW